eukprot:364033-Hanusia_phi.AAC.1
MESKDWAASQQGRSRLSELTFTTSRDDMYRGGLPFSFHNLQGTHQDVENKKRSPHPNEHQVSDENVVLTENRRPGKP